MQIPDADRFEAYLKQFRPLLPDPLPLKEIRTKRRRNLAFAVSVAGAVAIIALVVVSLRILNRQISGERDHAGLIQVHAPTQPLTIHDADALLAKSSSFKSLMDELAFPSKDLTVSPEKHSALAVLAKEKIRL